MKRIAQDIKENKFQKVYLLTGEEAYLRLQYKDRLKKALVAEDDTMNFYTASGKDLDISEVIGFAETMPFLAERRVILIEDSGIFGANASGGELADYLKEMPDSCCIIFNEEKADKRSKMYKAVKNEGYVAEFSRLGEADIKRWVLGKLKAEGLGITEQALEDFLNSAGDDMMQVKSEFEKLTSYVYGKKGINAEDVAAVCTQRVEDKIFAMLDDMMGGRCERALDKYKDLLILREEPGHIMYMIERQIKQLLHVKQLRRDNKTPDEIAKILGANPYGIRKTIPQAEKADVRMLKDALRLCADTDVDSRSGKMDPQLGVELIIISIANRSKL